MQILLPNLQVRPGFNTLIVTNPIYEHLYSLKYGDTFWLTSQISDQHNVIARFVSVDKKPLSALTPTDIGSNHFYRTRIELEDYLFLIDPGASKHTNCYVVGFDITDESFRLAEPINRMHRSIF